MGHDFGGLIDDALQAFWQREPVTASFAGEAAHDARLPRADAPGERDECARLDALLERLAQGDVPDEPGARLDARHLRAQAAVATSAYARRARYENPAWYSGEANFGIIALLLGSPERAAAALGPRVRAIPDYFDVGADRLRSVPVPAAWAGRARRELAALVRLLHDARALHPVGGALDATDIACVAAAAERLANAFAAAPDADAACGSEHLALVMERVHGLEETPAQLERRAAAAFCTLSAELAEEAARLDPTRTWREQLAALGELGPSGDVVATYADWNARALAAGRRWVSPADEYGLTFAPLPAWAANVAGDLYFLFYRSPAAADPGAGSTYWVSPIEGSAQELRRAHNTAAVKLIHAAHHGSIGHHTQNARARRAASRFARIAGTDGASGIALLAGGSLVEGWACYAEEVLAEDPDFYTPAERLQLRYFELRNIATTLGDVRFHTGAYTLEAMRNFYRDDVAFAASRIESETTRNSMFPGSRLMYWTGMERIAALRRASPLDAKAFHDRLLGHGSAAVAWIAAELSR